MSMKFWNKRPAANGMPRPGDPEWEKALVARVVEESLGHQRRGHRWGVIFKLLTFIYLFALLALLWPEDYLAPLGVGEDHTALVEVSGAIAPDMPASADKIVTALRKAFEDEHTKGIILRCNSPGGSPVQAGYVYDEIRRLRKKHPDIKLYAVISDVCASGGYYIAAAADAIYADKASLVGSIGVRLGTFGFEEAMQRLGVERRLLTAGENKAILDPFSPFPEDQKRFLQGVLDQLHGQFIAVVKEGRGERLKGGDELFSGLFWSGEEALALGLVDGLASSGKVAREVIGAEEIVKYTAKEDLLDELLDRFGATLGATLARVVGGGYPL